MKGTKVETFPSQNMGLVDGWPKKWGEKWKYALLSFLTSYLGKIIKIKPCTCKLGLSVSPSLTLSLSISSVSCRPIPSCSETQNRRNQNPWSRWGRGRKKIRGDGNEKIDK